MPILNIEKGKKMKKETKTFKRIMRVIGCYYRALPIHELDQIN